MRKTDLLQELIPRIQADYSFKLSADGQWFNSGVCPSCNKRELFARADAPWYLNCGRESKCGESFRVIELYASEFVDLEKKYLPTAENPHATAIAYLCLSRGLDASRFAGHFEQAQYGHAFCEPRATATVRFWVDKPAGIYMDRFIKPVMVTEKDGSKDLRKQTFGGSYGGRWWTCSNIDQGDTVYITEACIDAMSLVSAGLKAVSILACRNFPRVELEKLKGKQIHWVWALDNDVAGKKFMRRHMERLQELDPDARQSVMLVPGEDKRDWNDLWQAGKLTADHISDYRHHGDLYCAPSAFQKGQLVWRHTNQKSFAFEFARRLYWWDLDQTAYDKALTEIEESDAGSKLTNEEQRESAAKQAGSISQIANCHPKFLYFQRSVITDESWYYIRIEQPIGAPVNAAFTGSQISANAEFKKRLLSVASGALYRGSSYHLDWLIQHKCDNLKTVEAIDYLGYVKDRGCYIYNDVAFIGGRRVEINAEDYFDLGNRLAVKSLFKPQRLRLAKHGGGYNKDWAEVLWDAFGAKGVVAAVAWFGALFANQIRSNLDSYPFLEIIGEAGAGKTTIIEFLWRLFGRNGEGIDPNKGTRAGLNRSLAQYSGMPIVFIESDRTEGHARRFDWEEVKPYFNGHGMSVKGVKNSGNETIETPFHGALVIAQNEPVMGSTAVLERIIHLHFDKSMHSTDSREATAKLGLMDSEEISWFLSLALSEEAQVVDTLKSRVPKVINRLLENPKINTLRIAENHAKFMVLAEEFGRITGLSEDKIAQTIILLRDMAVERQQRIGADSDPVSQFWDVYEYLQSDTDNRLHVNHSNEAQLIMINLNQFVERASERRQNLPPLTDLKRALKDSRSSPYVDQRVVASRLHGGGEPKSLRCWVFERKSRQT